MKRSKAECYILERPEKFTSEKEAFKEMKSTYQYMKRTIKKHKGDIRYEDISFITGISNTEKDNARAVYIKKKTKGRPKKIILGTRNNWHIHTYISNPNASLFPFYEDVKKYLNKRGFYTKKVPHDSIQVATNYVEKQCTSIWRYGDDFQSKKNDEKVYLNQDFK